MVDADEALVAALRRGDPGAADRLVARFAKPVLNFVFATVRDGHASEDIMQEALTAVLRNIGTYRDGSFSGWIFRISRNLALRHVRDRGRDARALASAPAPEVPERDDDMLAALRAAMETLDDGDREVVTLVDLNGLSYRDAGDVVGVSEKALSVRLARARGRLRDAVKARMATP